jgi:hypothetical protein
MAINNHSVLVTLIYAKIIMMKTNCLLLNGCNNFTSQHTEQNSARTWGTRARMGTQTLTAMLGYITKYEKK